MCRTNIYALRLAPILISNAHFSGHCPLISLPGSVRVAPRRPIPQNIASRGHDGNTDKRVRLVGMGVNP